jgi:hypothetical protein
MGQFGMRQAFTLSAIQLLSQQKRRITDCGQFVLLATLVAILTTK